MDKIEDILVDTDEKIISVLGNGYILTFLSTGRLGKGFAVLSDKRFYFKGKNFYFTENRKGLHSKVEEKTINLKDITGTGFERINPLEFLIFGIICLLIGLGLGISLDFDDFSFFPLFLGTICINVYFLKKKNIFNIDYAGGNIGFDLRLISKEEAEEFQKTLRKCKDKAESRL